MRRNPLVTIILLLTVGFSTTATAQKNTTKPVATPPQYPLDSARIAALPRLKLAEILPELIFQKGMRGRGISKATLSANGRILLRIVAEQDKKVMCTSDYSDENIPGTVYDYRVTPIGLSLFTKTDLNARKPLINWYSRRDAKKSVMVDEAGNVIGEASMPAGIDDTNQVVMLYDMDEHGYLMSIKGFGKSNPNLLFKNNLDINGRLMSNAVVVKKGLQQVNIFGYTPEGRLISIKGNNEVYSFDYDRYGRVLKMSLLQGKSLKSVYKYEYDTYGRPVMHTYERFYFDSKKESILMLNEESYTINYDAIGRLTDIVAFLGSATTQAPGKIKFVLKYEE